MSPREMIFEETDIVVRGPVDQRSVIAPDCESSAIPPASPANARSSHLASRKNDEADGVGPTMRRRNGFAASSIACLKPLSALIPAVTTTASARSFLLPSSWIRLVTVCDGVTMTRGRGHREHPLLGDSSDGLRLVIFRIYRPDFSLKSGREHILDNHPAKRSAAI